MIDITGIDVDRFIYLRHSTLQDTEPNKIIFEFNAGPTIGEFKIICKRMASALGYSSNIIQSEFGDDDYDITGSLENDILNKKNFIEKI